MNKEIIDAIKATKNANELKVLAAEKGYPLTDEEASSYFDMYHTSGKIGDNELDNVSGGLCRNGRQYSTDPGHYLIVTFGNDCDLYREPIDEPGIGVNCYNCVNSFMKGGPGNLILYCSKRTWENDPYNPRHVK